MKLVADEDGRGRFEGDWEESLSASIIINYLVVMLLTGEERFSPKALLGICVEYDTKMYV